PARGRPQRRAAPPDLDLLYEEARAQLDNQLSSMDSLDTKIGVALALGGAEAALAAAALALQRPATPPLWLLVLLWALIPAFVLSYGALAWVALPALRPEAVSIGPALDEVGAASARGEPAARIKARVARTLREHYLDNEQRIKRPKQRRLTWSLRLLVA